MKKTAKDRYREKTKMMLVSKEFKEAIDSVFPAGKRVRATKELAGIILGEKITRQQILKFINFFGTSYEVGSCENIFGEDYCGGCQNYFLCDFAKENHAEAEKVTFLPEKIIRFLILRGVKTEDFESVCDKYVENISTGYLLCSVFCWKKEPK